MKNDTVAVVVTYNRLTLLQSCLKALYNQTAPCDILVIDNASTDGTREYLDEVSNISVVHMHENTGGAGGFFHGMNVACKTGYSNIWVMDDDCIPACDALSMFLSADKKLKGQYGWLSSQCLWTDGSRCPMNIQMSTPYKAVQHFRDPLIPAQMASFVSLFIKADVIRLLGLPIREFVIWTDDWEFTRRISRRFLCYVVRDSIVTHAMKNKTVVNIAGDSEDRIPRYNYFYRNDVVLYRGEGPRGWCWLLLKDAWHSLQSIAKGKNRAVKVIWRGFYEGCHFSPLIEFPETCEA